MTVGARNTLLGLAAAAALAGAFRLLGLPLPYILGGLFGSALTANLAGPMAAARPIRRAAQLVIGAAVAGMLTPDALEELRRLLPAMLICAVALNAAGLAMAYPIARIARVDRLTALLACLPAGMSEMASLARDLGARDHVVATIHALRVILVIGFAPLWLGVAAGAARAPAPSVTGADLVRLAVFLAASGLIARAAARLGMLNPWAVTPMALGLLLVGGGLAGPQTPSALAICAQIAIGASLGTRLDVAALRALPNASLAGMVSTAGLAGCAFLLFAPALGYVEGLGPASAKLAVAPGGLGEMIATAQAVGVSSAAIAGFQFLRNLLTNAVTPLIVKRLAS